MTTHLAWLAPDPVLPHRDVLLDVETMHRRLANALGRSVSLRIDRCESVRVNYQVAKSLRVLYAIEVGRSRRLVAARMFREGRSAEAFRRAAAGAFEPDLTAPVAHDPDIDCVFWSFPNDRKIGSLPLLTAPTDALSRVVPGGWSASRLVAYAPEKSATAACLDRAGEVTAYAKVSAGGQTERDFGFYQALRARLADNDRHLKIPEPLALLRPARILLLETIRGRRVGEGDEWFNPLRRMGAALGRFHRCAVDNAPPFTRFDSERLENAARTLARLRPDLDGAAVGLARRLIEGRPPVADLVCLHGDVHPKNAIITGDRVALLDVEDLANGPAAADLGSLLASLLYLHVGGCLSEGAYAGRASAFLSGYSSVRPVPESGSLAWHVAASLFIERAVRAVTRLRPLGLSHLGPLLERAGRVLAGRLHV